MKDYKEKLDRPFEEIPVPFTVDNDSLATAESLLRRQFREEDNVHYESEEGKRERKRKAREIIKLKQRLRKIVIPRLHKKLEKKMFDLKFGSKNQNYYDILRSLKLVNNQKNCRFIKRKTRLLYNKILKIYKCYQLFKNLKLKFRKILTAKQYAYFKLYYDKCIPRDMIGNKLDTTYIEVREGLRTGERHLYKKLDKEDCKKYLELKKIRGRILKEIKERIGSSTSPKTV